jgi:2,4-dienoyl-CoA reductase (NADPH2)
LVGQALSLHSWKRKATDSLEQWGPSDVRLLKSSGEVKAMTCEDIQEFTRQVVSCAKILQASGWDGIEVIAGVGSTLSRFMSKKTNLRTDEYGGSIENRCRATTDLIKAIKQECGSEYPVLVRWSPVDFLEGGNEIEDALQIAPLLEQAGANWHNLQIGWHESPVPLTTKAIPDGHWSYISAKIKGVAHVPVVTGYRETDPVIMEEIIASGKADLIGGARYMIADPEFAKKVTEGRPEDINMCICCCRCLDDVVSRGLGLRYCGVNPRLGKELEEPLRQCETPKKVLIVGSGPAGLSAAVTAYKRGNFVTIYERGPRIGGCVNMAAIFSPLYERLVNTYTTFLEKNPDIQIRFNTPATQEVVRQLNPDVIIVASGGKAQGIDVPGIMQDNVVKSHDFMELLNGKTPRKHGMLSKFMWFGGSVFMKMFFSPRRVRNMLSLKWPFGKRVGIIGGGMPGCELALMLIENKREVIVIEEKKKVGFDVGPSERFHVTSALKNSPRSMMEPLTKVQRISGKAIHVIQEDGTDKCFDVDTIAITLGFDKSPEFFEQLEMSAEIVQGVGDCIEPARIADATKAGYLAAINW